MRDTWDNNQLFLAHTGARAEDTGDLIYCGGKSFLGNTPDAGRMEFCQPLICCSFPVLLCGRYLAPDSEPLQVGPAQGLRLDRKHKPLLSSGTFFWISPGDSGHTVPKGGNSNKFFPPAPLPTRGLSLCLHYSKAGSGISGLPSFHFWHQANKTQVILFPE